jgi:hypothetical protein
MWNDKRFDRAAKKLPALYSTEEIKAEDKQIVMHLFIGGCDWWVCEGDVKEGVLFGYAVLNQDWDNAEWGYASIEELKATRIPTKGRDIKTGKEISMGYIEVDYDMHWQAIKFSDIPAIHENVYHLLPKEKLTAREVIGSEEMGRLTKAGLAHEEEGALVLHLPETPAFEEDYPELWREAWLDAHPEVV